MNNASVPSIEILVCAYNEATNLPRLFESIRAQSFKPKALRIILVDNASTDDTQELLQNYVQGLNLEYIYESHLGKNWACNAGYQHARADYVAHIDADCKADPFWLETIVRVIESERPDLLGGAYLPYYVSSKPVWYLDRYNSYSLGECQRYLREGEYLAGFNMVWRRSVVERLGGFRPGVGIAGRGFVRGDETELMVRARSEIPDLKVYYHPGIVVYHLTRTRSFSLAYWARSSFEQGRHDRLIWSSTSQPHSDLLALPKVAVQFVRIVASILFGLSFRDRKQYSYAQNYIYECVLPQIKILGMLYEQAQLSYR